MGVRLAYGCLRLRGGIADEVGDGDETAVPGSDLPLVVVGGEALDELFELRV